MNKKQTNKHAAYSTPKSSTWKGSIKILGAVIMMGGLIFTLVNASVNKSNLVPYAQIQKTKPTKTQTEEESSQTLKPQETQAAAVSEPDLKDVVQPVMNTGTSGSSTLPRETLKLIQKGMEYSEAGKFNFADVEFEKASKISPNSAELFAIWGTALRMNKKYKAANRKFARADQLSPRDEEIKFNWGMSKLMGGEIDGAIDLFQQSIELNPNNPMTFNYLGKALGRKKNYPKEELNYRRALELQPNFAQAHFNLAVVLSIQNKLDDAAPHFEKAIALDPEFNKPFVQRFLQQYGKVKEIKKNNENKSPDLNKEAQTAKLDAETADAMKDTHKSEGSEHKMEGSYDGVEKDVTNISGKITVNGDSIGKNAVVFLETKDKMKVPGQKVQNVTITQNNLQFSPAHSVVMSGSTLTFMNSDREVHNIFSKSSNNQFNLGAMAAGTSRSISVTDPGPIVLRCNLHKDMIGTVFVVPNGYYAQPDETGQYAFSFVKSKEYIMQVWHPRLYPQEIEKNTKQVKLTGRDAVFNFEIESNSKSGEIHDLVDATDYDAIVDTIEKLVNEAIDSWKDGKKYAPRKHMLIAITKHFDGEGLKGAIAKSFSVKRSDNLEKKLDSIRKKISGIKKAGDQVTEESLRNEAAFVISQLRTNVQELKARLNPDAVKK